MIYIEKHDSEIFISNNTDLSRNTADAGIAFAIEHSWWQLCNNIAIPPDIIIYYESLAR